MKISVLDAGTLGKDINLLSFPELSQAKIYVKTNYGETADRIADSDVIILNKVKIGNKEIENASNLKLICITATGFDNVDLEACREKGIAVCNVKGYSTDSVAQTTVASVLSLVMNLGFYDRFVKSGEYTKSGLHNRLEPAFYELSGKTWGIVGYGDIGKKVADVARAFGCNILAYSRTEKKDVENVDIDTLCEKSDIITLHLPLTEKTKHVIGKKQLDKMKRSVILYNAARGAVTDEEAVAEAVKNGNIGAFGTDVYSIEPLRSDNPIYTIKDMDNVVLTPHLAWGAYEARVRCVKEVIENIKSFEAGRQRNRVI